MKLHFKKIYENLFLFIVRFYLIKAKKKKKHNVRITSSNGTHWILTIKGIRGLFFG